MLTVKSSTDCKQNTDSACFPSISSDAGKLIVCQAGAEAPGDGVQEEHGDQ